MVLLERLGILSENDGRREYVAGASVRSPPGGAPAAAPTGKHILAYCRPH